MHALGVNAMSFRSNALDQRTLLALAVAIAVSGCAKKEQPAAPAPAAAPEAPAAATALEGQVDIVAWPGYIERGETDKNYDWVTQFEQDTGCTVPPRMRRSEASPEAVTRS